MVLSPPLATADQIVLQHAELLQVLADVRKRNKGGRNDKHDTARVRFIKDFALRGLRFGKLVPTADLDMIRLEPKAQLSGPKLASMDAWDKRHAPDPRSANEGVAIDLTVAGDAGFPRTRLTALLDGGRQQSGGGIAAGRHDIVVTRHRRRHATTVSSDFFCVPFGGRANGRVCQQYLQRR